MVFNSKKKKSDGLVLFSINGSIRVELNINKPTRVSSQCEEEEGH